MATNGDIRPTDLLEKEGVAPILASSIKGLIPVVDLQEAFTSELHAQISSAQMRVPSEVGNSSAMTVNRPTDRVKLVATLVVFALLAVGAYFGWQTHQKMSHSTEIADTGQVSLAVANPATTKSRNDLSVPFSQQDTPAAMQCAEPSLLNRAKARQLQFYGDVPSTLSCADGNEKSLAESLICANPSLQLAELVAVRDFVYATENGTKTEVDHSTFGAQSKALWANCSDVGCLCAAFKAISDDARGTTSPYYNATPASQEVVAATLPSSHPPVSNLKSNAPNPNVRTEAETLEAVAAVLKTGMPEGMPIVRWDAMGYEFDSRTRIFVTVDNFSRPTRCTVDQLGIRTATGTLTVPKFALTYLIVKDREVMWLTSVDGPRAAVRVSFDQRQDYVEIAPMSDGAVVAKASGKLEAFNSASSMKVLHSSSPASETAFVYDLVSMRKAIALARQACR